MRTRGWLVGGLAVLVAAASACSSGSTQKLGTGTSTQFGKDGGLGTSDDETEEDGGLKDATMGIYRDVEFPDVDDAGADAPVDAPTTVPIDANVFECTQQTIAYSLNNFSPDPNTAPSGFISGWQYEVGLTPVGTPVMALVFDNLMSGPTVTLSAGEVQSDGSGGWEFTQVAQTQFMTDVPLTRTNYDANHFSLPDVNLSAFDAAFGGGNYNITRLYFAGASAEIEFDPGCGGIVGLLHVIIPVASNEYTSFGTGTLSDLLGSPNYQLTGQGNPDAWAVDLVANSTSAQSITFHR